jgi:signal transduction histidine kinase
MAVTELTAPLVGVRPSFGIPRRTVLVVASAVVFALALVLLPGSHPGLGESALAAALGASAVALTTVWAAPALARVGPALAYVGMVAVLIDGGGGTSSGFGGLFLLPLLWLAIVGTRSELALGFVAVGVARALPVKLIGAPEYPPSAWRTGLVLGAVAVIGCVTIQELVRVARLRADELELQNEKLRELDQVKDGFVALVSHELRTPLTSIIGFLEILLDEDGASLTSEQRRFLATVNRNVDRLATLVDELLFLVQVDAGGLELQLAEADPKELLADTIEAARPAANAKNIRLTFDAGDVAPVLCDRGRMAQLLDNLVSNALKFTPEGGEVAARAVQSGDAVALSVSDTGIGIPAEELPRLFVRFFRTSNATELGIPGTGLGLAISQAIAEAHDSVISVESTAGGGTTFRLLLAAA